MAEREADSIEVAITKKEFQILSETHIRLAGIAQKANILGQQLRELERENRYHIKMGNGLMESITKVARLQTGVEDLELPAPLFRNGGFDSRFEVNTYSIRWSAPGIDSGERHDRHVREHEAHRAESEGQNGNTDRNDQNVDSAAENGKAESESESPGGH